MQAKTEVKRYVWVTLAAILGVAFFLRVVGLDEVPPAVFGDEVDVGYQAYSLWKTGRDYTGQWLPTYIRSFSEWRAPLLMYVTAPFVGVFGLNEWGLRLPDAVLGVVTVGLVWWLAQLLWGNWKVSLVAAGILALSPWHLQYSRSAFEASLLLFLLVFAAVAFFMGLKEGKKWWWGLTGLVLGLTFYTYSTANVFVPLFVALLTLGSLKRVKSWGWRNWWPGIAAFLVVSLPMGYNLFFGHAADRFGKFSVFSDSQLIDQINRDRMVAGDTWVEKLFHNKPVVWGRRMVSNYFTGISPQFLFIDGDVTFRHSIHQIGELFWIQVPLILGGLYWLVSRRERRGWLVLGWLVIAPIPASLTWDGQVHATRLILLLVPLTLISAYGLVKLVEVVGSKWRKVLMIGVGLIFIGELVLYLHRYFVHYPLESWRWWHYGYKQAITEIEKRQGEFSVVALNDTYEPTLIRFLFWTAYDPKVFQASFSVGDDRYKQEILPGFDGFKLSEKYYFGQVRQGEMEKLLLPGVLYLASQSRDAGGDWDWSKSAPGGVKVTATITAPTGEPLFFLVTGGK